KERKNSRFKSRVNNHFKDNVSKNSSVNSVECLSNKNNIKEERKINEIEKYQVIKYFNKSNFLCKEILPFLLTLNVDKDTMIKIIKNIKRVENKLLKNTNLNKSCFKEKQEKLKKILNNTQKEFEQNGYNPEQLKTNLQKVYENYK
ncbi:plasmid maintenance protein, partial [Borreliella burgdorferi]